MPKPQQPQTPYDTLFAIIFGQQKPSRSRSKPGPGVSMPPMTGVGEVLGQVATAPWMYPTDQVLTDIDKELDKSFQAKVKVLEAGDSSAEINVGVGGIFKLIGNPRGFIDKAFAGYKYGEKLGRWGAVSRTMDQGLLAIMAKRKGLSGGTAWAIGNSASDINRTTGGVGNTIPGQTAGYVAQRNAAVNYTKYGSKQFSTGVKISEDEMREMMLKSEKAIVPAGDSRAQKIARRDALRAELAGKGYAGTDVDDFLDEVWGKETDDGDFGIAVSGISGGQQKNIQIRSWKSAIKLVEQERNACTDLKRQRELDKMIVFMKKYESGGAFLTLGRGIGTVRNLNEWRKDSLSSGVFIGAFLTGNASKISDIFTAGGFRGEDLTFLKEDPSWAGNVNIGRNAQNQVTSVYGMQGPKSFMVGTNSRSGKVLEALYYWHPVNIIKGAVWDGRLWAKLARHYDVAGNATLAARYTKLASRTPKQMLSMLRNRLTKWLGTKSFLGKLQDGVKKKVLDWGVKLLGKASADLAALPFKELLKQILAKILTQLITKLLGQVIANAVLPGIGIVVGIVLDIAMKVAVKLAKPMVELIVLLLFGAVALVFIICAGTTNMTKNLMRNLNNPITALDGTESPGPTVGQDQWADSSIAPSGLSCLTPVSSISCTQGSCGDTSHARSGTRAVDIAWGGMRSTSRLYAPTGGTVRVVTADKVCSDGTHHGGVVEFTDVNGYTWTIYHVKGVTSGTVAAGQPLAEVMFSPQVQKGRCWTGAHAHVEVQDPSGNYVDAPTFLNTAGCSFSCPAEDAC